MSVLTRWMPSIFSTIPRAVCASVQARLGFHFLTHEAATDVAPGGPYDVSARNVIRIHFPRPSERKRIKRHGYWHRMSTPGGRRVIMRRILKGRHVYTH